MAGEQSCHWPLCQIHTLPKQKGVIARLRQSLFPQNQVSNNAVLKAKILELPVELIELIANHLPTASAVAFALTNQYMYQCIGTKACASLKASDVLSKTDFLIYLQRDFPSHSHCTFCQMLHLKRAALSSPEDCLDGRIDIGLRSQGLLITIPLSDIRSIQRYHNSYSKDSTCPGILSCYGTAHGPSGLSLSYITTARISGCHILWHGIFHIDWVGPRANPNSFFAQTPFQLCEHNRLIQNKLVTKIPKTKNQFYSTSQSVPMLPFVTTLPLKTAHERKQSNGNGDPATICMCCPNRMYGCAYCDTDWIVSYIEDIPNQRQYKIDVWKNFGNMHLDSEYFPRKDLGWHRKSFFRRSAQPAEHWRDYPGAVKRMYTGPFVECSHE